MANRRDEFEEVLRAAHAQARRSGHGYVGTEDLLLAVLDQRDAPIARLLASFGITHHAVSTRHAALPGRSSPAAPVVLAPPGITLTIGESETATESSASSSSEFTPAGLRAMTASHTIAGEGKPIRLAHLMAALLADHNVCNGLLQITVRAQQLPPETIAQLGEAVERFIEDTQAE